MFERNARASVKGAKEGVVGGRVYFYRLKTRGID